MSLIKESCVNHPADSPTAPGLPSRVASRVAAMCDHFMQMQSPWGRPDPTRTRMASYGIDRRYVSPTQFHAPAFMALALYTAGRRLERPDYLAAADRYVLYHLAAVRDPFKGRWDAYAQQIERDTADSEIAFTPRYDQNLLCRSWLVGIGLDALCRGFMRAHPEETSFHAKAAALYDWLQAFRTDAGHYFNIGYTASSSSIERDGAFSDDLGLVGRGLISYHEILPRPEVLADLQGLAEYYVREHQPGLARGCFSSDLGTWVICPWPEQIAAEHFSEVKHADQIGWGFSNREAVDFLLRLDPFLDPGPMRDRLRTRVVSGMKWSFDRCQHDDGGVGMLGRDDAFVGMTGAAISNYVECKAAGVLDAGTLAAYEPRARAAFDWLLSWNESEIIEGVGYRAVSGKVSLNPPENLAWMLAWGVHGMLDATEFYR